LRLTLCSLEITGDEIEISWPRPRTRWRRCLTPKQTGKLLNDDRERSFRPNKPGMSTVRRGSGTTVPRRACWFSPTRLFPPLARAATSGLRAYHNL